MPNRAQVIAFGLTAILSGVVVWIRFPKMGIGGAALAVAAIIVVSGLSSVAGQVTLGRWLDSRRKDQ